MYFLAHLRQDVKKKKYLISLRKRSIKKKKKIARRHVNDRLNEYSRERSHNEIFRANSRKPSTNVTQTALFSRRIIHPCIGCSRARCALWQGGAAHRYAQRGAYTYICEPESLWQRKSKVSRRQGGGGSYVAACERIRRYCMQSSHLQVSIPRMRAYALRFYLSPAMPASYTLKGKRWRVERSERRRERGREGG